MSFAKDVGKVLKIWQFWFVILLGSLALFVVWYFLWFGNPQWLYWIKLVGGLLVFLVPGVGMYGILTHFPRIGFSHITFGFSISLLLFAVLGFVGRLFELSFDAITFAMLVFGLAILLFYMWQLFMRGIKFDLDRQKIERHLPVLPAILIALLAGWISAQRVLSDDDLTYLAFQNIFQSAEILYFNFPIFSSEHLASPRFWLVSASFAHAFLTEISDVPAIFVLGGYYEPFLVLLSALSWYELALALKLSPKSASASVILQFTILLLLSEYLHPGSPFFYQLSTDKSIAAFILAPIFFQSLITLLEKRTRSNLILYSLTGLSLTFMHPIILAYAVAIASAFILLSSSKTNFRQNVLPILILVLILIPQVVLRFIRVPEFEGISLDAGVILAQSGSNALVTQWEGTSFYAFNFNILSMHFPYQEKIPLPAALLQWGWMVIPLFSTIFAIFHREKAIARLIISASLLCFFAGFPLTGWVLGYFLNGRMLARAVWLFPYGLSAVYLLVALQTRIRHRFALFPHWGLPILTLLSFTLFSTYIVEQDFHHKQNFFKKSQRYQGLVIAGQELDWRISDYAYILGSEKLNDLVPGISTKPRLITFRALSPSQVPYFTEAERQERISDTQKLFSKSLSPKDKMSLIEKYQIEFLFLQPFDIRLFEDFIDSYPDRVEVVDVGGVTLLQISD